LEDEQALEAEQQQDANIDAKRQLGAEQWFSGIEG